LPEAAAACAQASDTATTALAPSRLLSGVPSRSIRRSSITFWSATLNARSAFADQALMFFTAAGTSSALASPAPVEAPAGAMARPEASGVLRGRR